MALPALQADVRFAEYVVDVEVAGGGGTEDTKEEGGDRADVSSAVRAFLAADAISWEHKRENEIRSYDLRAQVEELEVGSVDGNTVRLRMKLKNDNTGSGRPEQVVAALGLPQPVRIHRTNLMLERKATAREAWRRQGRFD
jgi:hypothetical protein